MRIDAHQHFWWLDTPFCAWPTPEERAIYADFGPVELEPLLEEHGIDGTILVQAAPAVAETEMLLNLGAETPFVSGVVGWIDMEAPDSVAELKGLAANPLLRGIRPMIQSIPDADWMLKPALAPVYDAMVELGLCFDALVLPVHLAPLATLARRHPGLSIIIDHGAKPEIGKSATNPGVMPQWSDGMSAFSGMPQVSCKLSGLLTEAGEGAGRLEVQPYLDHLYDVFGADRLMWGSDWPVLLMANTYSRWLSICEEWLAEKSVADADKIMGDTACRIYGVGHGHEAALQAAGR